MTVQSLHQHTIRGERFEVPAFYKVREAVGEGRCGVVCSARDELNNELVAIKKIEHRRDSCVSAWQTLHELHMLRLLRHENLVEVKDVYLADLSGALLGQPSLDMYVVTELMETDMANILKSDMELSNDHCMFFLYQILRGMKYVHSAGVIHQDLKPRNLLVNGNCDLKICDFMAALPTHEGGVPEECLTPYHLLQNINEMVSSPLWYRAPELLCPFREYGDAVDIWSIGCIFAEMIRRSPIFMGWSTFEVLTNINQIVGTPGPEEEVFRRIPNRKCQQFLRALPGPSVPLEKALCRENGKPVPEHAVDMLERALRFDPSQRESVVGLLQHPYLAELHCPEDEPQRNALSTEDLLTVEEGYQGDWQAVSKEYYMEALRYFPRRVPYSIAAFRAAAAAEVAVNNRGLGPEVLEVV